MPTIDGHWQGRHENPYVVEQLNYSTDDEQCLWEENMTLLNNDQRVAFDRIYLSTCTHDGKSFFLHRPGGTGKTFLYNTLCHRIHADNDIFLCIASFGIASLLLPGGHTAHSTFCIPVETLCKDSICQIDKNSKHADMLHCIHLIIWDEAVT
jgi:hypothetical protein